MLLIFNWLQRFADLSHFSFSLSHFTVFFVSRGIGLAAFIAETVQGVAGNVELPKGYLADVYAHIRENGGVTIADEVRTSIIPLCCFFLSLRLTVLSFFPSLSVRLRVYLAFFRVV